MSVKNRNETLSIEKQIVRELRNLSGQLKVGSEMRVEGKNC